MKLPTDRMYTESHEWFLANGDVVTMGITQFAADELTDITYVELPEIGTQVAVGTLQVSAPLHTLPSSHWGSEEQTTERRAPKSWVMVPPAKTLGSPKVLELPSL